MQIRCPVCNALTTWKENNFRPFCSERCKMVDLGRWASEQYKIVEPIENPQEVDRKTVAEGDITDDTHKKGG